MKHQRKVQKEKAVAVLDRLAALERRVALLEASVVAPTVTWLWGERIRPESADQTCVRRTEAVWAVSPVGERCSGHGGVE